jgi:Ca-activated chloride channel homolog
MKRKAFLLLLMTILVGASSVPPITGNRISAQSGRKPAKPSRSPSPQIYRSEKNEKSKQEQPTESDEGESIKIDTTLVNIPIVASDRQGKYIPNLQADEFVLFENGVRQEIEFFSSEIVPFHVVLMLDVSSSTRNYLYAIQRAARDFVANLRPGDKVKVISFSDEINTHNNFTSDRVTLERAIRSVKSGGSTRLFDALLLAARNELKKIEGRKALILLTDGDDTGSYMHSKYAINELIESGSLVYAVRYPDPSLRGSQAANQSRTHRRVEVEYPYPYPYNFIGEMIDKTGGTIFEATSITDLSGPMRDVAEELRYVYIIGYQPANPITNGGYRKIEITLRNHPAVVLRYKKGYEANVRGQRSN